MMYFYIKFKFIDNYIINLVFNHFPFARIQGDVLFKLSIKSEMLLLALRKTERISSDFASKKIRVKNELGFELFN
jgi:hypothetical protein